MKISDVPLQHHLEGAHARVLAYLNDRPDEVFRADDFGEIAQDAGLGEEEVADAVRWLHREGFILRARLGREVWYGCTVAVETLASARSTAVLF